MPATYLRGGLPVHMNLTTAVATVQKWEIRQGIANQIRFKNLGSETLYLAFDEDHANATDGVGVAPNEIWEAPVEVAEFFTYAPATATSCEVVVYLRRG